MKHYLVDTNIVIDLLANRENAAAAYAVFAGAGEGKYRLYLCALSLTNIYYTTRKYLSHDERINALVKLREAIDIIPVDADVLDMALGSGWKDFEDAVQYYSAKSNPLIGGIINRNAKDFRQSELKIMDSSEFL